MDLQLIAALVAGIATIVIIVLATRLDAFIALLIAALVTGVVAGQDLLSLIDAVTTGFGTTLASIGIVIGLGVGIGKILEVSGAADSLARAFLRAFGKGREPWAMGSVGSLVSIPVFCDSGYVIMNPLARSIARDDDEKEALLNVMLPPMLVGGFTSVSAGSVVIASILVSLL